MEYTFSIFRKLTQVMFIISAIVCSVIFTGIGIMGLTGISEDGTLIIEPNQMDEFIISVIFTILGATLVCAAFILIIKRPFAKEIRFTEEGIIYEHKDIFFRWDDVKKIKVARFRHNSLLVISTTFDERVKLRDIFKKKTPEQISLECRKELHPILDEYWMGQVENYLSSDDNYDTYLIFIISLEIISLIFFLILFFIIFHRM